MPSPYEHPVGRGSGIVASRYPGWGGCGQADYLKKLRRERPDIPIWGVEFFSCTGDYLDTAATHRMIDAICAYLVEHERFAVVLSDYVLNSIDSQQAEDEDEEIEAAFATRV